jgi:hypothetical protein
MISLGTLSPNKDPNDSMARAVNDSRYVIGKSGTGNKEGAFGYDYAWFLYHASFGMLKLESLVLDPLPDYLKGVYLNPVRINARGQICGPEVRQSGEPAGQAYLLTPVP